MTRVNLAPKIGLEHTAVNAYIMHTFRYCLCRWFLRRDASRRSRNFWWSRKYSWCLYSWEMLTITYYAKFVFKTRFEPLFYIHYTCISYLDHILVIYVEYEADNTSYYDKYFSIIFADWGSHTPHFLWACLSLCFRLCFLLTCDLADDLRICFTFLLLFISCFRIIHHTRLPS